MNQIGYIVYYNYWRVDMQTWFVRDKTTLGLKSHWKSWHNANAVIVFFMSDTYITKQISHLTPTDKITNLFPIFLNKITFNLLFILSLKWSNFCNVSMVVWLLPHCHIFFHYFTMHVRCFGLARPSSGIFYV